MTNTVDRHEDSILHDLKAHGLLADTAGWQVAPAEGGLNSRVYFLRRGEGPPELTVRASHPESAWMLEREAAVLGEVSATCSCAPAVSGLVSSGSSVLLVHGHAAGAPEPLASLSSDRLTRLAGCLAGIHAHHRKQYAIWPDLVEIQGTRAQAFLARLGAIERYAGFNDQSCGDLYRGVRRVYQHLQRARLTGEGWDERTFSLLHGDLSRGNIIWDGNEVMLIDWEYSRPGDPAEDIAYLLAEQEVSDSQAQVLSEGYVAAGGDPTAISRVPAYAALVSLDSLLWWMDLHLERGEDPRVSPEVAYHLSRAKTALSLG